MTQTDQRGNRYLYLKNFNTYKVQVDSKLLLLENSIEHLKSQSKRLRVSVTVLTIILTSLLCVSFLSR